MCRTHVSTRWFYHLDACAGSVLTPHDYISNVQRRLGNRVCTGFGQYRLCGTFLDPQLEHGETCSTAEATRGHYVLCSRRLGWTKPNPEGSQQRNPFRLIFSLLAVPGRSAALGVCEAPPNAAAAQGDAAQAAFDRTETITDRKIIWRINFRLQTESRVLRINFRYKSRSQSFENNFRCGYTKVTSRTVTEERSNDTQHVLRQDENGRGWPGSAVARVAPQCGIGASTSVDAGPIPSPRVKSFCLFFVCVCLSVCLSVCLCEPCLRRAQSQEKLWRHVAILSGKKAAALADPLLTQQGLVLPKASTSYSS